MRTTRLEQRQKTAARPPSVRYAAPALDKGLDILELFASRPEGLTTSQVARHLGRTVGEIFRMLVCLAERGYISQVLPDERFQLTLKLFELAHRHHPLQRIVAEARPLMEEVAHKTRQSCHLAMPSNAEVVVVAQVDAPGSAGFALKLGARIDLLNTASGHVLLAFQRDEMRARSLAAWRRQTDRPLPADLEEHLARIRERGYEEMASYQVSGVVNVSFPVLNQHEEAIATLSVPFLPRIGDRVGPIQVRAALQAASQALSTAIGG
ncbi:MAG: IclR family transcriptional regulator [Candidatus Acidiferrales bacterium]|jgi:DNA-binding IclR family transcriptional regulator